MAPSPCRSLAVVLPVLAGLFLTGPVRAADLDQYLPADTEILVTLNIKQILESSPVKKAGLEKARQALKEEPNAEAILKDLGFDPFKDLDKVIAAGPGGKDKDKGLIILRGRFDQDKFKAKAEDTIKEHGDLLKAHKVPGAPNPVYEITVPNQDIPLFVTLASGTTILASPGKDYVVDALKKGGGGVALKNKDFQALLERMDAKQSLSFAAVGSALSGSGVEGTVKELLGNVDAVGGGLTLDDEIKVEVVVSAKSTESAKDIHTAISDGLNQGLAVLGLLAGQAKEIAPALEVVKSLKTSTKGKTVTVKGQISLEAIEDAVKEKKDK